jgi:hypothetical protein
MNNDDDPNVPMTGWDTDDGPVPTPETPANPGVLLLQAISSYIGATHSEVDQNPDAFNARFELLQAMRGVDWNAIGFTLDALQAGDELFACHPNNDVLLKYTPRRYPDPDQPELAF